MVRQWFRGAETVEFYKGSREDGYGWTRLDGHLTTVSGKGPRRETVVGIVVKNFVSRRETSFCR